jgi:hypothetical protein
MVDEVDGEDVAGEGAVEGRCIIAQESKNTNNPCVGCYAFLKVRHCSRCVTNEILQLTTAPDGSM